MSIAATGVRVVYGDAVILDDVTLSVPDGGWLGLLGPNGAGKTTLLRVLAGLVARDAGTVDVAGLDPRHTPRRRIAAQVALVDQRPVLPPGMSVAEYVLLGRAPHVPLLGAETSHDHHVAAQAMARLDVIRFARRDVLTLSGGEAQRAVLARALAQEAPVLLLDEPTAALDLGHQQEVLELVDVLRRERDLTVVATMHDLTSAGQFSDEVVLLSGGRVAAAGTPRDVLTEASVARHFDATVRVVDDGDGGVLVLPVRSRTATGDRA